MCVPFTFMFHLASSYNKPFLSICYVLSTFITAFDSHNKLLMCDYHFTIKEIASRDG